MKTQTYSASINEEYILVRWPESQILYNKEWFNECVLAVSIESSAYFVPKHRYNTLYPHDKPIKK
jgi:hypothetical protein